MKNHSKTILFILIAIGLLYFAKNHYSSFNVKRSTHACMMAQMQIKPEMKREEVRKFCDDYIKSQIQK